MLVRTSGGYWTHRGAGISASSRTGIGFGSDRGQTNLDEFALPADKIHGVVMALVCAALKTLLNLSLIHI